MSSRTLKIGVNLEVARLHDVLCGHGLQVLSEVLLGDQEGLLTLDVVTVPGHVGQEAVCVYGLLHREALLHAELVDGADVDVLDVGATGEAAACGADHDEHVLIRTFVDEFASATIGIDGVCDRSSASAGGAGDVARIGRVEVKVGESDRVKVGEHTIAVQKRVRLNAGSQVTVEGRTARLGGQKVVVGLACLLAGVPVERKLDGVVRGVAVTVLSDVDEVRREEGPGRVEGARLHAGGAVAAADTAGIIQTSLGNGTIDVGQVGDPVAAHAGRKVAGGLVFDGNGHVVVARGLVLAARARAVVAAADPAGILLGGGERPDVVASLLKAGRGRVGGAGTAGAVVGSERAGVDGGIHTKTIIDLVHADVVGHGSRGVSGERICTGSLNGQQALVGVARIIVCVSGVVNNHLEDKVLHWILRLDDSKDDAIAGILTKIAASCAGG